MPNSNSTPLQMSLGVSLNDFATFSNFYTTAENKLSLNILNALSTSQSDGSAYIVWGVPGSGLTHLLQATCHQFYAQGRSAQFLPMSDVLTCSPDEIFNGLETTSLVCLDGIAAICGNPGWERGVFHLFNNLRDAGHTLIMSSHHSPSALPIALNDLKSRVLGSMFVHIESLSDEDKQFAMIMRARERGIELSNDVAKYILSRASRGTHELFDILDKLDNASLQQQRKLTIPFVREVVGL